MPHLRHLRLAIELARIHAGGVEVYDQVAEQHAIAQRHGQNTYLGVGQGGLVVRWYYLAAHQPGNAFAPQISIDSCCCRGCCCRDRGHCCSGSSIAAKIVGGHLLALSGS